MPLDRAPETHDAPRTARGRSIRRTRERDERRKVAGEICVLYHEAVRAEVATLTKGGKRHRPSRELSDLDASTRKAFIRAARIAIEEGADAREFVVAQFAVWRAAGAYHKKFMLPSPQQLCTEGARVRYWQHKGNVEIRRSRVVTFEEQDDRARFYVEERQLRGMARATRRDPSDVLAEEPERFSREFLVRKGAWEAVKDAWEERRA